MLRKVAELEERRGLEAKIESLTGSQEMITVFREREAATINNRTPTPKLLTLGLEWKMGVDSSIFQKKSAASPCCQMWSVGPWD